MSKLKNTFKTDILFKLLFIKHPDLLRRLVAHLLRIQLESITQFEIRNQEMPPEVIGNKFCRLDIHMMINEQQVNLEVQVEDEGDFPERAIFHWARIFSNALPAGGKYSDLPRTIVISIVDFHLFSCPEFYSEYQALEVTRHEPLAEKMVFHFFELPKVSEDINRNDILLLWLALFKADTEEELSKIEALGVPELNQAISAYHSVTASSEFRELERLRAKARHDEAQALHHAEKKGEAKGRAEGRTEGILAIACNMLKRNRPIDEIMEDTGLTRDEVETLRGCNNS
ncbi:MAG: Rpn family recombination-promoting nuclease/putative transposase [Synergistaceae bacterium]|nr:Rpn family recombination-promoting nuclease/putative transposase [Synergistaceae bacterium]